jgi:hypothetical protein
MSRTLRGEVLWRPMTGDIEADRRLRRPILDYAHPEHMPATVAPDSTLMRTRSTLSAIRASTGPLKLLPTMPLPHERRAMTPFQAGRWEVFPG